MRPENGGAYIDGADDFDVLIFGFQKIDSEAARNLLAGLRLVRSSQPDDQNLLQHVGEEYIDDVVQAVLAAIGSGEAGISEHAKDMLLEYTEVKSEAED